MRLWQIWSVALDSQKGLVLSAGHDGFCKVWPCDPNAGKAERSAEGGVRLASRATLKHPKWVTSVSVDGTIAATGCADTKVRLWSLETFACMHTLEHGGGAKLTGISWISTALIGGGLISGGQEDGLVKVWSLSPAELESKSGGCIATLAHGQSVRGVAASLQLGFIVSAGGYSGGPKAQSGACIVVWWPSPIETAPYQPLATRPNDAIVGNAAADDQKRRSSIMMKRRATTLF